MKMINCEQQAWGDKCLYEVEESEIVQRPYYGFVDREKFELREAVQIGRYANGQAKFEFIFRENGKAFVECFHSIGD